jgi:uncharacterized membrane protein YhhN
MPFVKKYGTIVFILLLLAHCLFIYFAMPGGRMISKLLLVPFLLIYLSASREGRLNRLVIAGLVFSFAGDLLLFFTGELYFLLGMFAFICTHVCNMIFFAQLQKGQPVSRALSSMVLMVFWMAGLGAYVFFMLGNRLGNLLVPIIVYMLIISAMAIAAAGSSRNALLAKAAAGFFIPGAALFALSDSILAMNKFLWQDPLADIAVMTTYGAAQFLLVKGFISVTRAKISYAAQ